MLIMCQKRLCSFSLPRYFQISFLSHALPVTGHRGGSIWEAIWEAHSSWDDPDNYRQTKRRSAHDNDCDLPTSVSSDGIDPTYNFHSEVLINDYKTVRKTDDCGHAMEIGLAMLHAPHLAINAAST